MRVHFIEIIYFKEISKILLGWSPQANAWLCRPAINQLHQELCTFTTWNLLQDGHFWRMEYRNRTKFPIQEHQTKLCWIESEYILFPIVQRGHMQIIPKVCLLFPSSFIGVNQSMIEKIPSCPALLLLHLIYSLLLCSSRFCHCYLE